MSNISNDSQPTTRVDTMMKGVSRRHFLATSAWMTTMFGLPIKSIPQVSAKNSVAESGKGDGLNKEKSNVAKVGDVFKPSDTVPVSGIYEVIHDRIDGQEHMGQHQITAKAGEMFPSCKGCQIWVRYRLHLAAENIKANAHFKP